MALMIEVNNESEMKAFGARVGGLLNGGEVIELIGDVGAGKTTLVHGVAKGLGIDEVIQSPSFTISRVYDALEGRLLAHYDFYRLADPGIMKDELDETMSDPTTIVIIEWADTVEQVLPDDKLIISIKSSAEDKRQLTLTGGGPKSQLLAEKLL